MSKVILTNEMLVSLLDKMAQNEIAAQQLYQDYAFYFLTHRELWNKMALEEEMHANILLKSKDNIALGSASSEISFTEEAVDTFINYIKEEQKKLKTGSVHLREALATSLGIEQSLLESRYFEVLSLCQNTDIRQKLFTDTKAHAKGVKNALKALTSSP